MMVLFSHENKTLNSLPPYHCYCSSHKLNTDSIFQILYNQGKWDKTFSDFQFIIFMKDEIDFAANENQFIWL